MIGPGLDRVEPHDPGLPHFNRPVAPPLDVPGDRLLSVHEVALLLRVSDRTVRRLACRKRDPLPGMQVTSRLWRFSRADVEAWLAARRSRAAA